MSTLMALLLATAPWMPAAPDARPCPSVAQETPGSTRAGTERAVLQKDGGPGHGPDQPYNIREQGAADLEQFVGGKQVVFVEPYDLCVVLLIVTLVVVLVIVL